MVSGLSVILERKTCSFDVDQISKDLFNKSYLSVTSWIKSLLLHKIKISLYHRFSWDVASVALRKFSSKSEFLYKVKLLHILWGISKEK